MILRKADVSAKIVKAGSQHHDWVHFTLEIGAGWYYCSDIWRLVQKVTSCNNIPTLVWPSKWRQQFRSNVLKFLAIYQIKRRHILQHSCVNLLKPTGHVMHQQFSIQQLYVLLTHCIYVFCIYLRTNNDLCHSYHKLIGFYNRDEKCLLRGTNWVFK